MKNCEPTFQMQTPTIIQCYLGHSDCFKKGNVPFHLIYQSKKPKVKTFVLPDSFATMFAHDKYFTEYYSPNIYEALSAHSTKYRRGRVEEEMVVSKEPFVHTDLKRRSRAARLDETAIEKMRHAWKLRQQTVRITMT